MPSVYVSTSVFPVVWKVPVCVIGLPSKVAAQSQFAAVVLHWKLLMGAPCDASAEVRTVPSSSHGALAASGPPSAARQDLGMVALPVPLMVRVSVYVMLA